MASAIYQGNVPKLNSFIYTLASKREKSTTPNKRGRKWVNAARDTQRHERVCFTITGHKEGLKIVKKWKQEETEKQRGENK